MTTTRIPFRSLLASELRRCLSRRAVHVLIGIALLGIVAMAVLAVVLTDPAQISPPGDGGEYNEGHIANLVDLWLGDGGGVIIQPIVLLAIGALLGGALVVGGEWKAGTVLTVATWEVRRPRLLGARLLACGILAPTIAIGLLGLFVAGTLPVVLTKGSTAGIDGAWLAGFAGTVGRGLLVVTFAALLGGAIASIARGATAAFVVLFALNAVIEPAIRGWFPGVSGWLLGENLAALVGGEVLDGDGFRRGPGVAGVLLAVYVTAVLVAATAIFDRRDLGSAA
ncbi:MAG: hypothetical protein H0V33_00700 [Acidimicrobiia bacterium]|nr:hypothetical protein [Acidimicrobiia bacterium]